MITDKEISEQLYEAYYMKKYSLIAGCFWVRF